MQQQKVLMQQVEDQLARLRAVAYAAPSSFPNPWAMQAAAPAPAVPPSMVAKSSLLYADGSVQPLPPPPVMAPPAMAQPPSFERDNSGVGDSLEASPTGAPAPGAARTAWQEGDTPRGTDELDKLLQEFLDHGGDLRRGGG